MADREVRSLYPFIKPARLGIAVFGGDTNGPAAIERRKYIAKQWIMP
jgi:hypothetical protein